MKTLMIGDLVGKPGRRTLINSLDELKKLHHIDITIANVENAAGGFSITPPLAEELFEAGVDVMTSGNHIFDKSEVIPYIKKKPELIRPLNYPPNTAGNGFFYGEVNGFRIAVLNVLGRVFMPPNVSDPFASIEAALKSIPNEYRLRFVDFHAEATSEKMAMGWFLDGRVSTVVGTHTHVQTADERILEQGTAYITDLGMTGSHSGVIGMDKIDVLERFQNVPAPRAKHSKGTNILCGIVVDINEETGKARKIERIRHKIS